ncbi:trichohyalin-like [Ruditapes philippinarum]|uniref:trichohyalin-like n=1 Tax=Ruditapes philippinarum TaxID=129788 RepID=UPI00295BF3A5|nr:trichohyalin-like [Ruditapes philippinarum]
MHLELLEKVKLIYLTHAIMTQVSRYPDIIDQKMEPPPNYSDIDKPENMSQNMSNLDDKIKSSLVELEGAKHDIGKVKTINKGLEKKIQEAKKDLDALRQKIDSLKVKLGLSNTSLGKSNDEKETMSTNLNESQVLVARLEERLSALNSELDKMRDPANPESNMSIRKHILNDKKEIKKLKVEAESERNSLEEDTETAKAKDAEIKALEKELAKAKEMLKICEEEREEVLHEEEEEKKLKEEMIRGYKLLKTDKKTYEQRLKEARIRLGVKTSGKNVNFKVLGDMKTREKDLARQLNQYERKLKEVNGELDILKNQNKMSKTAMSINKYTKRNLKDSDSISMAQSGLGPVKFGSKVPKTQPEKGALSNRSRLSESDKSRTKGGDTDRSSNASFPQKNKGSTSQKDKLIVVPRQQQNISKGDRKNSTSFVPPPKAKLRGNVS